MTRIFFLFLTDILWGYKLLKNKINKNHWTANFPDVQRATPVGVGYHSVAIIVTIIMTYKLSTATGLTHTAELLQTLSVIFLRSCVSMSHPTP